MWTYEKRLQYPVNIKNSNPALAKLIIAQYGGPYFNLLWYLYFLQNGKIPRQPTGQRGNRFVYLLKLLPPQWLAM